LFSNELKLKGLELKLRRGKALLFSKKIERKREEKMFAWSTLRFLLGHAWPWDNSFNDMNLTMSIIINFEDWMLSRALPNHSGPAHTLACLYQSFKIYLNCHLSKSLIKNKKKYLFSSWVLAGGMFEKGNKI